MLLAQQDRYGTVRRRALMLDSFQGLPAVTDRDGPLARAWQANTTSPIYYDNCRASLADVRAGMQALNLRRWVAGSLCAGWFEATVPSLADRLRAEGIALLRSTATGMSRRWSASSIWRRWWPRRA